MRGSSRSKHEGSHFWATFWRWVLALILALISQLCRPRRCNAPGQAARNHWRAAVSTTPNVLKIFKLWLVYPPSKLRHHAAHPRASALLLGDDDGSDVLGARHGPPLACIRAPLPRKGFSTSLVVSAPSTKG